VEHVDPIRLPIAPARSFEHDLAEITAAVELVLHHVATRVTLTGLRDPRAVAGRGLALAQRANVRFALERTPGDETDVIVVGPLEA
jgi:hypothetical protein